MRLILGVKFKYEDKRAIKKLKAKYFLYGNHTGATDAYTPGLITSPYKNKIVVSPAAVSIRGIRTLVQMLGGLPVPGCTTAGKNFLSAIEYYNNAGYPIVIYPEAHIWPYYNGIRSFGDVSFSYPVKLNRPAVAFVTCFEKPKWGLRKVKRTIYVSKPFYPDTIKPAKEARKELRDNIYNWMKETTEKHSPYAYIQYIQTEKTSQQ